MSRPPKDIARQLLEARGRPVRMTGAVLSEDEHGQPEGVGHVDTTAPLAITPEMLGWTQAELDDPTVTE